MAKRTRRTPVTKSTPVNEQIRAREVVVIDENGEHLGVLPLEKAIARAKEQGLALVAVNPATDPPITKIVDYGKFAYDQQKKERKARAHQKAHGLKHIQIKYKTGEHDLQTKARRAKGFLEEGHKVRLEIFLRGREKAHRDMAQERLKDFKKTVEEMVEGELRVIEEMKKTPRGHIMTVAK